MTAERFAGHDGPCGAPTDDVDVEPAGRTALTLRVQTGCEERCSYCIIPSTRGRSRSLPLEAVLSDITQAAAAGFHELIVTGVHLGSYGRDLSPASSLETLVDALDRHPSTLLFRISSVEPMDCTSGIVERMAHSHRLAPHFHLPLQHASDRMLHAMRRPYTLDTYRRTVDRIRTLMPHASIGADVIAGFPGESQDDFETMQRYLEGSPLTHLHVFPYSDRPGTEAGRMSDRVPGPVVRERARVLRATGAELVRQFHASQLGATRPALTIGDGSIAMTDNYLRVALRPGPVRNERIRVQILSVGDGLLGGMVVN